MAIADIAARVDPDTRSCRGGAADCRFGGGAESGGGSQLRGGRSTVHRNRPGNVLCGLGLLRHVFQRVKLPVINARRVSCDERNLPQTI